MFAAMFFLIIGDIAIIANLTNFTIFIVFLAVNAAVIYLRYKSPQTQNGFRIPLAIGKMPVIPLLGFCSVAFMLISLPLEVLGLGAILGFLGILFYYLFYLHKKGKGKKGNFSK
jgi:APA family basic amino acid/polyamine antiporter